MRAKAPPRFVNTLEVDLPREASKATRVRRILALALNAAEGHAHGNMVRLEVERPGERYPRMRYARPLKADDLQPITAGPDRGNYYNAGERCRCGGFAVPLPHYMGKRFGWHHAIYCPVCDLPGLVDQCVRIDRYARTGDPGRSNGAT